VHSGAFRASNVDALFFMLWWVRCSFLKKCAETCYAELAFLHKVGYIGHIVHFGESGRETSVHYFSCPVGTCTDWTKSAMGQVVLNLCFSIWWDLQVTYCIPVRPGYETSLHYYSFSSGPVRIP
jgi:hypothetical protein